MPTRPTPCATSLAASLSPALGGSATQTRYATEHYTLRTFDPTKLREGMQLPEFCWDDAGAFVWGGGLYPDSFIIAAEQRLYRQFSHDPRLDTVEVIPNRDVLPVSSGD